MQYIKFPKNILLSYKIVNNILSEYDKVNLVYSNQVCLDFSETNWIDGELTTLLGVLAGNLSVEGYSVYVTGVSGNAKEILGKNKFLEIHKLGESIKDDFSSTIPYVIFNSSSIKQIGAYLDNIVFPKIDSHMAQMDLDIIRDSIFELLQNVKDHAESDRVLLCGQYFHKKKKIELAFADIGVSIPLKVKNNPELLFKSDHDCIDWATLMGNSTKQIPSSGLGLYELRENILGLGEMTIISNKGFWRMGSKGELKGGNLDYEFPGTLINLTFFLPDNDKREKLFDNEDTISDLFF